MTAPNVSATVRRMPERPLTDLELIERLLDLRDEVLSLHAGSAFGANTVRALDRVICQIIGAYERHLAAQELPPKIQEQLNRAQAMARESRRDDPDSA